MEDINGLDMTPMIRFFLLSSNQYCFVLFSLFFMMSFTSKAQYEFSYEINVNSDSRASDIHLFGESYLFKVNQLEFRPLRQGQATGIIAEYDLSFGPTVLHEYSSSFSSVKHLPLSNVLAAVVTQGKLDGEEEGYWISVIDEYGDFIKSTPFQKIGLLSRYAITKFEESGFSFIRGTLRDKELLSVTHYNDNLDSIGGFEVSRADTNVVLLAANIDSAGNFYFVIEETVPEANFFQTRCMKMSREGHELWSFDLSGSTLPKKFVAIEPLAENNVAILEGYLNDADLSCAVESCPRPGDFVGGLSLFSSTGDRQEFYKLGFYPFGMYLDQLGYPIVYGVPVLNSSTSKSILFKASGWLDGDSILVLNSPDDTSHGTSTGNEVRRLRNIGNGEIIGAGTLKYFGATATSWFFRLSINDCLANDCGAVEPGDFPVSTDTEEKNFSLTLHPNPVPATLNVQLSSPLPSEVAVTLYDLNGRALRQAKFRDNLSWELADLAPGVYVAVFTHEGARVVRKVVKE
ncbi:T9SS type A sorting domain-containing protein [Neolewinella agarilytica]|uniref:Por secretion system C-terminal sorting domain-containing protein n=1 Tax=Neolewinella agarilytica TaxID=478744 RepID=A0A1H9EJZ5_9BACT|nr:T9SS type A sorting domain-containing protein [Neolewinella agarilytica]SEQ26001.1 Por secretion system C-terminal sorting domain-containing protein [Neolewinella agarilytica]